MRPPLRFGHMLRQGLRLVQDPPTDNALVESFNGRLRDECLNANWFLSLADARSKIETWRRHYDESRPHTALGWRTPQEFALAAALQAAE